MKKPLVIAVDGIDGCGKTTLIAHLFDIYTEQGKKVVVESMIPTKEIKEVIVNNKEYSDCQKMLLLMIEQTTTANRITSAAYSEDPPDIVLLDRSPWALQAYQLYADGVPEVHYYNAKRTMEACVKPDVYILVDIEPSEALKRISAVRKPDLIESKGEDYLSKVALGFDDLFQEAQETNAHSSVPKNVLCRLDNNDGRTAALRRLDAELLVEEITTGVTLIEEAKQTMIGSLKSNNTVSFGNVAKADPENGVVDYE